jgi:hypothetical protein
MSGGPVFNQDGHLCGIVCSGLPPELPRELPILTMRVCVGIGIAV